MSQPERGAPVNQAEASRQPQMNHELRQPPIDENLHYNPETSSEKVREKLNHLQSLPPEQVTNKDLFEIIADVFTTRAALYDARSAEEPQEAQKDYDVVSDEITFFEGQIGKQFLISYETDPQETTYFEEASDDNPGFLFEFNNAGEIVVSLFDAQEDPGVGEPTPEQRTFIIERLAQGHESPLGD